MNQNRSFHKLINTFLLFSLSLIISCSQTEFNSERWKAYPTTQEPESIRWEMMDDLIDNYELLTMDTTAVFELLGPAVIVTSLNTYSVFYSLGPCKSGISYGTLELVFGDDKVFQIIQRCN